MKICKIWNFLQMCRNRKLLCAKDTLTHADARYARVITAAAIYARVFLYVYIYIISVSLKDLIIISVVITVDVKVYTEAMLINTIYLYLIFCLRFLSPFITYFYFSCHERFTSFNTRSNFGSKLWRMPSNAVKGYRNISFNSRHRGFDFTRACVSL